MIDAKMLQDFINAGSAIYIKESQFHAPIGYAQITEKGDFFFAGLFPEAQNHCHTLRKVKDYVQIHSRAFKFTAGLNGVRSDVTIGIMDDFEEWKPTHDKWIKYLKTLKGKGCLTFCEEEMKFQTK